MSNTNDMILSLDCPAIRGFRHEREVIEEATLYYMNYGADAMKYARNHFFMFDPIIYNAVPAVMEQTSERFLVVHPVFFILLIDPVHPLLITNI